MNQWRHARTADALVSETTDSAGAIWRMTPVNDNGPDQPPTSWQLTRRDRLDDYQVIEHRGGLREFEVADRIIDA